MPQEENVVKGIENGRGQCDCPSPLDICQTIRLCGSMTERSERAAMSWWRTTLLM